VSTSCSSLLALPGLPELLDSPHQAGHQRFPTSHAPAALSAGVSAHPNPILAFGSSLHRMFKKHILAAPPAPGGQQFPGQFPVAMPVLMGLTHPPPPCPSSTLTSRNTNFVTNQWQLPFLLQHSIVEIASTVHCLAVGRGDNSHSLQNF
jgi:hypothetical protein